jgi:dTDP-4-amino-4,6-dideoxygalactose transaminase
LLEKLKIFPAEINSRNDIARRYEAALSDIVRTPGFPVGVTSVWAQYTLRIPGGRRDAVMKALRDHGIPSAVYYPRPLHHQTAYAHYPIPGNGLPVAEQLCAEVLSLPMHPYLTREEHEGVIAAFATALHG